MDEILRQSLNILHIHETPTNKQYFSAMNLSKIQERVIQDTRSMTGYTISPQNCNSIVMAMQYFYINYPQLTISDNVSDNIEKLNSLVLDDLLKQTVNGVNQYIGYLKYIERTPEPLEYGTSTSIKGQESLQTGDYIGI